MALLAVAVAVPAGGCAANVDDGLAGRVILFDGSSWDEWVTRAGGPSGWVVGSDGSILVRDGDAITRRDFGDFQLHLEFLCPENKGQEGQGRSNSGVYLHGRYEVQVFSS